MIFRILLLISCLAIAINGDSIRRSELKVLDSLFDARKYDSRLRPDGNSSSDSPVDVITNFYIRSLEPLDEKNQQMKAQLTFRQEWKDSRLQFDDQNGKIPYLSVKNIDLVWKPDTFFSNELDGHFHDILTPNVLVRIYPDGTVLFSMRLSLVLNCPMEFRTFPFDRQTCDIKFASYAFTAKNVNFKWKSDNAVQISTTIRSKLPIMQLKKFRLNDCTSTTTTGTYSCLKAELMFERDLRSTLIHVFIPCLMFVVVSYFSFFIHHGQVAPRLLLTLITLLIAGTNIARMTEQFPTTSRTKAIDVWTGVTMTFIWSTLVEFVVVQFMARRRIQGRDLDGDTEKSKAQPLLGDISMKNSMSNLDKVLSLSNPETIDYFARIVFPVLFGLFVMVYVATFLPRPAVAGNWTDYQ